MDGVLHTILKALNDSVPNLVLIETDKRYVTIGDVYAMVDGAGKLSNNIIDELLASPVVPDMLKHALSLARESRNR